jgi:AcrR family transcriptional regulator
MWTPTTSTPQHGEVDTVNMVQGGGDVRRYHHGDLRVALIDTAVEQARIGGADAVVLREAARRTGVSHNAAYRHFADRDDLLAEVAERGMGLLEERMHEALTSVPAADPPALARQRLRAVGRAYVRFALAEPGLFSTAFKCGRPAANGAGTAHGPYGILTSTLDELVDAGVLPPDRRPGAELTCWAAVHGFAVLCLQGPLRDLTAADREAHLEGLLDRVARGL